MTIEGKITVDLKADGTVLLNSNRSASVSDLLIGRNPEGALTVLPKIYSLCAHAHIAAARLAMGLELTAKEMRVVLAENAREHLLRIMIGWKAANDTIQLPAQPVMQLVDEMQASKDGHSTAIMLTAYLEAHVLGCTPQQFLELDSLAQLDEWMTASDTVPSAYLAEIANNNWQGLGAGPTMFLPKLDAKNLQDQLARPGFSQQPDWLGSPRETGPFSRQFNHSLIKDIVRTHGAGLMARMVSRLVELALLPDQMLQNNEPAISTTGLGAVETARGRLIHAVKLNGGIIVNYSILAPTEWNFHPRGVAAQSLRGLNANQARAIIEAIDPCVDYELRVA